MRVVLWILEGVFLLLLAALLVPIRLHLTAAANLRGGHGVIRACWLFIRVCIPFRLRLLDEPCLSCDVLRRNGAVMVRLETLEKVYETNIFAEAAVDALRISAFDISWTAGLRDEPAACALLSGTLTSATEQAIERLPFAITRETTRISAQPAFCHDALRLDLEGMLQLRLVDSMERILRRNRRGSGRKTAKRKEKGD